MNDYDELTSKSKISDDTTVLRGSYRVLLPDGSSQVVNFEADNSGKNLGAPCVHYSSIIKLHANTTCKFRFQIPYMIWIKQKMKHILKAIHRNPSSKKN